MKYISAYALLVLGGNTNPSEADLKNVLASVGAEFDNEKLKQTIEALRGKQLHELIEEGSKKMSNLSIGSNGNQANTRTEVVSSKDNKIDEKAAKTNTEANKPVQQAEPDVDMSIGLFGEEDF